MLHMHAVRKLELSGAVASDSKEFTAQLQARHQRRRAPKSVRDEWPVAERARRPVDSSERRGAATHRQFDNKHTRRRAMHPATRVDLDTLLEPPPDRQGAQTHRDGTTGAAAIRFPPVAPARSDGVWIPKGPTEPVLRRRARRAAHPPRDTRRPSHHLVGHMVATKHAVYDLQGGVSPQTTIPQPMARWGRHVGQHDWRHNLEAPAATEFEAVDAGERDGSCLGYLCEQGPLATLLPQEDQLLDLMARGEYVDDEAANIQVSGRPLVNQSQQLTRPIYLWSFVDSLYPVVDADAGGTQPIYMAQPPTYGARVARPVAEPSPWLRPIPLEGMPRISTAVSVTEETPLANMSLASLAPASVPAGVPGGAQLTQGAAEVPPHLATSRPPEGASEGKGNAAPTGDASSPPAADATAISAAGPPVGMLGRQSMVSTGMLGPSSPEEGRSKRGSLGSKLAVDNQVRLGATAALGGPQAGLASRKPSAAGAVSEWAGGGPGSRRDSKASG